MIRDTAAANKSLDNDYGASKGANAPASHTLHLFAGDPAIPAADGGGVELTSAGGYSAPTITNNGTSWQPAANGQKNGVNVTFPASTGAWSAVATHWALLGSDGLWWDTGVLGSAINITAAGVTKTVAPRIFYGTRI
jgi:hypothetical protein